MTECQKWKNDNPGKNCVAKKGSNQRLAVMNGNAYKTTGGLTKKDLTRNKQGRIVSKKASQKAKKGWKTLKKNPDFKENQKLVKSDGKKGLKKKYKVITTQRMDGRSAEKKCGKVKNKNLCDTIPNCNWKKSPKGKMICAARHGVNQGKQYEGPLGPATGLATFKVRKGKLVRKVKTKKVQKKAHSAPAKLNKKSKKSKKKANTA